MKNEGRIGLWLTFATVVLAIPGSIVDERQLLDGPPAPQAPSKAPAPTTTVPTTAPTTTTTAPLVVEGTVSGTGGLQAEVHNPDGSGASSDLWVEGDSTGTSRVGPDEATVEGGGGMGGGGGSVQVTPPPG